MNFFTAPTHCPACSASLSMKGEYLLCTNPDCPAQILGGVTRWLGKTGVLHFGGEMAQAAIDAGVIESLGDLYRITESQLSALEMDGRRVGGAAKRAYESLHATKEMPLETLVGSLGIDLCGRRMVEMLVKAGFDSLEKLDSATVNDLSMVDGFGLTKAVAFKKGFNAKKPVILDLLAAGVTIKQPQVKKLTGSKMRGVSVCFTGVRDAALEAEIIAQGGEIKSGVSRGLSILVCKDTGSGSSKATKARELGTEVVSLQDMWARVK
jgi:DNA ligase (NAD+)